MCVVVASFFILLRLQERMSCMPRSNEGCPGDNVEKSGRNMHFVKVRRVSMVEFKGTGGRGGEGRRENLGLIGHLVLWCRNYKTSP